MMHLRGGVGIRGIVSLWVICGAHVGPTMLVGKTRWIGGLRFTVLGTFGGIALGGWVRPFEGCAEALFVGPFTVFFIYCRACSVFTVSVLLIQH